MSTIKTTNYEKVDAEPCTKEHLRELTHQLANNRSIINWSVYVLCNNRPAEQERQTNQEMLDRNCSDTLVLFTRFQTCFQQLDPTADYRSLFVSLTDSVNQLQAVQTAQLLATFERLIKRLKRLIEMYVKK